MLGRNFRCGILVSKHITAVVPYKLPFEFVDQCASENVLKSRVKNDVNAANHVQTDAQFIISSLGNVCRMN